MSVFQMEKVWIMRHIPGTWHNSLTVNTAVELKNRASSEKWKIILTVEESYQLLLKYLTIMPATA